jgi:hypothetical protein
MCEYYLDYYTGSISKINQYFLFLSINYNFRLLEKFIYFYDKVIVVKKGSTPCLNTSDKSCLGAIRLEGMDWSSWLANDVLWKVVIGGSKAFNTYKDVQDLSRS